jgi:hypothetical protein
MRKTLIALSSLLLAAGVLAGCSDDSTGQSAGTGNGQTIEITIKDGAVVPNGERVEAKVDEPITLEVTADAPGEIHVHSTPEQEIEYDAGTSSHKLTIDKPGIVDVESHTLDKTIVQLEVS